MSQKYNKVIGFILGNAKNDKTHISNLIDSLEFNNNTIELLMNIEEN